MSEEQVKQSLREWIARNNGDLDPKHIENDTAIVDQRYLKSIQVMDLILYIEKLRSSPVDVSNIQPGVFKSINTIYSGFFAAH